MENEPRLFEEYAEKMSFSRRIRQPGFWVKVFMLIVSLVFIFVLYNALKGTWSKSDVESSMTVIPVDTGWMEGKSELREPVTRILPYFKFRIKNSGTSPLKFVNFECVFEFSSDGLTQTTGFFAAFNEPLNPGDESDEILITGVNGYTASSREAFVKNKDKWRQVNAKLFARTKGSPHVRLGDIYPVEQKIKGEGEDLSIGSGTGLSGKLEPVLVEAAWTYRSVEGGDVIVYPSVTLKVKNTGTEVLENLGLKAVFLFSRNGERFHFGFPAVKGALEPGRESEEIMIRSEFGIRATSLQSLYDNIFEWDDVTAKVYVKSMDTDYDLLGEFYVKKEVKGVKIISQ